MSTIFNISDKIKLRNHNPFLLEVYSGAAAAYSLRLLDSTYSGNAVKVRRASDNTEQDIGFVDNELDTSSLETFCSGTDGFVTTWYDQSGNNVNATQTTASRQPKIINAGSTITYLSKPSILYNGTSQYIQNSLPTYSSSEQYYIVGEGFTDNVRGAQTIRGGSLWRDGSVFRFLNGGSIYFTTGSPANNLLVVQLNASDADLYLNNVAATESGSFSPTYNTTSLIGAAPGVGTYHDSFISEYIVWGNTDNRNEKQTNINDFYSIY